MKKKIKKRERIKKWCWDEWIIKYQSKIRKIRKWKKKKKKKQERKRE